MSHRWHLAFHSGMSASSDLRAAVDVGVPIGVVAPLLSLSKVFLALPRHLDSGGSLLTPVPLRPSKRVKPSFGSGCFKNTSP